MKTKPEMLRRRVLLVILDGFGINPGKLNNGIALANTPILDDYFSRYSHTTLHASGAAVGLPDGQMGNSEVGHLTLGSGCVIRQDLVLIDEAVASGSIKTNAVFANAMLAAKEVNRPLHLIGLVSDGGVHSHLNHLLALIEMCKDYGCRPVVHVITDGRDTAPTSAMRYIKRVEQALNEAGGCIASIMGRYYAMDRDSRWDRIEMAWRALRLGEGRRIHSALSGVESAYDEGETDEFIKPLILNPADVIADGDHIITFNFRKDRMRQIVSALGVQEFLGFERPDAQTLPKVNCLMPYDKALNLPYAFEPDRPAVTLAEVLSQAGLKQLHCAETEKYAHVTYFFNGGKSDTYPGESHILVPSPQVATYDLQPEMSAEGVADSVVEAIEHGEHEFIVVNFANGDMVGHTGDRDAIIKAVEALDAQVGRVLDAAEQADYSVVLTADHGNCEEILDPSTGDVQTQHTSYPVPCMVIDESAWQLTSTAGISSIAPTVLALMGIEQPKEMQGRSLLLREVHREEKHKTATYQGAA